MLTATDLQLLTRLDALRIIRDDFNANTDAGLTLADADVLFDQECYHFGEVLASTGVRYAVCNYPIAARYLATKWTGEDRKRIRAELAARLGLAA